MLPKTNITIYEYAGRQGGSPPCLTISQTLLRLALS
jgi:hypothetical protein